MLTSTVMGHWSPLAWLSFALDYSLGGLEPRVYHATNLALHALNAALVCVVARLLLRPVLCPRGGEAAVGRGRWGRRSYSRSIRCAPRRWPGSRTAGTTAPPA